MSRNRRDLTHTLSLSLSFFFSLYVNDLGVEGSRAVHSDAIALRRRKSQCCPALFVTTAAPLPGTPCFSQETPRNAFTQDRAISASLHAR
jgi:hypothetical protein